MNRLRQLISAIAAAIAVALVLAPAALAADGEGLWGRTDDKVVTFFSFAVIAFFALFVIIASLIQIRLENRKERARAELERLRRP